jgi:antitoxin component YwqK of YwqJK toxin-antitoxin module
MSEPITVDAVYALKTLIDLIKPIIGKYNNPFNEGSNQEWEKYCRLDYMFNEQITKTSVCGRIMNSLYFQDLIPYVYKLLLGNAIMESGSFNHQNGWGSPITKVSYPIIFDDLCIIMREFINKIMPEKEIEQQVKTYDTWAQFKSGKHMYIGVYFNYLTHFYAPIKNRQKLIQTVIELESEYGSTLTYSSKDYLRNELLSLCLKEKNINKGFIKYDNTKYEINEFGQKHGIYERKDNNGNLRERYNNKNNKKNGLYELWHNNGRLAVRCNYINDKLYGLMQTWHKNGQLYIKADFVNDERKGLYESWDATGVLINRERF